MYLSLYAASVRKDKGIRMSKNLEKFFKALDECNKEARLNKHAYIPDSPATGEIKERWLNLTPNERTDLVFAYDLCSTDVCDVARDQEYIKIPLTMIRAIRQSPAWESLLDNVLLQTLETRRMSYRTTDAQGRRVEHKTGGRLVGPQFSKRQRGDGGAAQD